MLPLPDHRTDYYLTIPLIGLAMLGGFGRLRRPCASRWVWQAAALIPLVAYLQLHDSGYADRLPLVAGPQPGSAGAGARSSGGARRHTPEKPSFWMASQAIFMTFRWPIPRSHRSG